MESCVSFSEASRTILITDLTVIIDYGLRFRLGSLRKNHHRTRVNEHYWHEFID